MNILFVLYGDLTTNTAIQIANFANQLSLLGHECVIAIPSGLTALDDQKALYKSTLFTTVLELEGRVFSTGERADLIHACTPRIIVGKFLKSYLRNWSTPLVLHLEDDESHITLNFLRIKIEELAQFSTEQLNHMLPEDVTHPHEYESLISMAELVILVQERLEILLPPAINCKSIHWGVDPNFFSPEIAPSRKWNDFLGIQEGDLVIVYPGGVNHVNRYAILDLCHAIEIINNLGFKCKLIRTGPNAFNFWDELSINAKDYIFDLGVVDRTELPSILALADIYVQPGRINSFEDLRLPSKLVEFFSMGKPIVLPAVHIAHKLEDGVDAIILSTGEPKEIAKACIQLFSDSNLSTRLGINARKFALNHFNLESQTQLLIDAYHEAIALYFKNSPDEINSY
jgi:glycosyltransferase involved in cell wall biosynthesis